MNGVNSSLKLIHVKSACDDCRVRQLCLPTSLNIQEQVLMDKLVKRRLLLRKGEYLYRTNEEFKGLFAIQTGSIKTVGFTREGREQVTGFHLAGELVGMDAIDENIHPCSAIALETSEVCLFPLEKLEATASKIPRLMHDFARIMSREILNEENALIMLGSASAEQRMARFLISMYKRQNSSGPEKDILKLKMTRQDIGNYLGLAFETVSRQLKHMEEIGLLHIENRKLTIRDMQKLESLAD